MNIPTIKNIKIIRGASIYLTVFIIGVFVGYRFKKEKPAIVATQAIETKTQEVTTSNIQENRQQVDDKEVVVLQKQYFPSGKISNYKKTTTDYTSTTKKQQVTISKTQTKVTEAEKDKEIVNPQKNWLLVGLIPASNYKDYSDYTLQVSYRVVGPVYASFQTNLIFNKPMIGIGIQF